MDDFSFPTIQTEKNSSCEEPPFPHYTSSPLWFLSSVSDEKTEDLKAFGEDEGAHGQVVNKEEEMDALWEDFNEDLRRGSIEWVKKDFKGLKIGSAIEVSDSEFDELKNRSLHHCRRPSLIAMMKVLKKLFLIQKNSSAKRAASNQI